MKHVHDKGHLHEFTFSCFQRRPLLTNDDWRRRLSRSLDAAIEEASFQLVAFVFMPEHVHLIVHPLDAEPRFGFFLSRVKQPFSKEIKRLLQTADAPLLKILTVQERPGKQCFRFWQEGPGYDRNLFSSEAILASLDYIHANPVNRDLCRAAVDWKWSSARYYLAEPPRQQDHDLPYIHGMPDGVLSLVFPGSALA